MPKGSLIEAIGAFQADRQRGTVSPLGFGPSDGEGEKGFSVALAKAKEELSDGDWADVFVAGIDNGAERVMKELAKVLKDRLDFDVLKKDLPRIVKRLRQGPRNLEDVEGRAWDGKGPSLRDVCHGFDRFSDALEEVIGDAREDGQAVVGELLADYLAAFYQRYSPYHAAVLFRLQQYADWAKAPAATRKAFVANAHAFLEQKAKVPGFFDKDEQRDLAIRPFIGFMHFCEDYRPDRASDELNKAMLGLYQFLGKQELVKKRKKTVWGECVESFIVHTFLGKGMEGKAASWAPFAGETMKHMWHKERELESLVGNAESFFSLLFREDEESAAAHVAPVAQRWAASKRPELLALINLAVMGERRRPTEAIAPHAGDFVKAAPGPHKDPTTSHTLLTILSSIASVQPKALLPHLDGLEKLLKEDTGLTAVRVLNTLAQTEPPAFKGRGDKYIAWVVHEAMASSPQLQETAVNFLAMTYAQIGKSSAKECGRVMEAMMGELKKRGGATASQTVLSGTMAQWTGHATLYPDVMLKHRPFIVQVKDANPTLASQCTHLLNLIDGRSLAKTDANVSDNKGRIDANEEELDAQGVAVAGTRKDVDRLGERVDDAEENIDELGTRSVSAAPRWAHEVSLLLNPERRVGDWRTVASRLGYDAGDVRAWATTANPTASLLADLYATRGTKDATAFLLKVLKDVNRMDAHAVILREEKAAAGAASDGPVEVRRPAPVFLSYQWGVQAEVKLLKERLERDGHRCWMDIHEMGGGDSLYEEIDRGIRAAKVMVLCMTPKYLESANCQREVNLGNGLGRRMLPLQMEKLEWPPPGSLGPILADRLFIRFYKRNGEAGEEKAYPWSKDKYAELLSQIREVTPAEKEAKGGSGEVFLSYQWEAQSVARALRKRLRAEGASVWKDLDCAEASGEEELGRQTKRALERSRVVLACLTKAYVGSPTCQSECRTAGQLGKPVLPLLLGSLRPADVKDSALRNLVAKESPIPFQPPSDDPTGPHWTNDSWKKLVQRLKDLKVSPFGRPDSTKSTKSHKEPAKSVAPVGARPASEKSKTLSSSHVCLFCSPDKQYEMGVLRGKLEKAGYSVRTATFKEERVEGLEGQVLLPALSLRFTKSPAALGALRKHREPVLPLLLDKVRVAEVASLVPVDCTLMRSRAEWKEDGEELEEILDRLEALVPDVQPIRAPKREVSSIPKRTDHFPSQRGPVPQDPLAREATEIRIQIRPPTPKDKDSSHIPMRERRSQSQSQPRSARAKPQLPRLPSKDSGKTASAKPRQSASKGPRRSSFSDAEGRGRKEPHKTYGRGPPPPPQRQRREPAGREATRREPVRGEAPKRDAPSPPTRKAPPAKPKPSYWDQDGPKLPSLYRQRFIRT